MRSVLVTGGTTRLGRHIAEGLRACGWRVLTTSHRPDAGADIVADFTDAAQVTQAYAEAIRLLDGLPPDALVNNAALFTGSPEVLTAIGFEAPKKLTFLMSTRESGRGAVVNILDADILQPADGAAPANAYLSAKRELFAFQRKAAALFAETLRINAVAPGAVLAPTEMHVRAGETLLGRPRVEDVVAAVRFLLAAESTTGAVLPVDGGRHLLV